MKKQNKQLLFYYFLFIIILILANKAIKDNNAPLLSPVVNTPRMKIQFIAKEVEAKEPAQTFDHVQKLIIDEFKELGSVYTTQALLIAQCESQYRPTAENCKNTNGTCDYGIFQINDIHGISKEKRINADFNIKWAKNKFIKDGKIWNAWINCKNRVIKK